MNCLAPGVLLATKSPAFSTPPVARCPIVERVHGSANGNGDIRCGVTRKSAAPMLATKGPPSAKKWMSLSA